MSLKQKVCVPCQGGIPPLALSEVNFFLNQVSDWKLEGNAKNISKRFEFSDFIKTLDFVNKLGLFKLDPPESEKIPDLFEDSEKIILSKEEKKRA